MLSASALGTMFITRLNGWPMFSPVNASPRPSRATAHDSGSMQIATLSSCASSTPCRLYRRTSNGTILLGKGWPQRPLQLHITATYKYPPPPEVTLLARHWDWLAKQPGGASATLRKLVEEARRASLGTDAIRASQERAYRFMAAMAGNLPNFEEATRALFANKGPRFSALISDCPDDVRDYAAALGRTSESRGVNEPRAMWR